VSGKTEEFTFSFVATVHEADHRPTREQMIAYLQKALILDVGFEGEGMAPEGCGDDANVTVGVLYDA